MDQITAVSPGDAWAVGGWSRTNYGRTRTLILHWNGTEVVVTSSGWNSPNRLVRGLLVLTVITVSAIVQAATAGATAAGQISAYPEIPFPLSGVGNVWHGKPQVKPSTWLMFADGSWVLEKLRWTDWGTKVAHATGISSASNGIPNQAQGKRIKKKAKVTLWHPGTVLGHRVYRCFALTLPKQPNRMVLCLKNSHGWIYLPTKAKPPGTTRGTSPTTTSPASRWTIQAELRPQRNQGSELDCGVVRVREFLFSGRFERELLRAVGDLHRVQRYVARRLLVRRDYRHRPGPQRYLLRLRDVLCRRG